MINKSEKARSKHMESSKTYKRTSLIIDSMQISKILLEREIENREMIIE